MKTRATRAAVTANGGGDIQVTSSNDKPAPVKKTKRATATKKKVLTPALDFARLQLDQVINESLNDKTITFKASYEDQLAIVRLEKTQFYEGPTKDALAQETTSDREFVNDCYHSFVLRPLNLLNDIKATVIHPATETHLAKYSRSDSIFVSETPDVYLRVVEPFLEKLKEADMHNWVYNILDGKSEADRVLLNDPDPNSGFMLIKDLKSSGEEKDLYLVAICHRRDIKSLRDLGEEHLILLKNIMTKGTKAIKDKHKKMKLQLRTFIHYQPTYYHFHVHFKAVDPSDYVATDRDHLLSTVINNISLNKDYYKKSTLNYPLSTSSSLYKALKDAKRV